MIKHKITILILLIIFGGILDFSFDKSIEFNARSNAKLQLNFVKNCVLSDPLVTTPSKFTMKNLSNRLDICASNLKISENSGISVISLQDMKLFWDSFTYPDHNKLGSCIQGPITDKQSYEECNKCMYLIHRGYNGSSTNNDANGVERWINWMILPTTGSTFMGLTKNEALKDNDISQLNQIAVLFRIESQSYLDSFKYVKYLGFFFLMIYIIYSIFVIYSDECSKRRTDKL